MASRPNPLTYTCEQWAAIAAMLDQAVKRSRSKDAKVVRALLPDLKEKVEVMQGLDPERPSQGELEGHLPAKAKTQPKLFIVRIYDGFDNQWCDVTGPVEEAEAKRVYAEKTNNGTQKTSYSDIDYYEIFPADTRMVYSGGFGARD